MISTKSKQFEQRSSEDGLTLIECLVAIVVIALTTASIGPMMLFSVATRVQNQKTEQALQLAQSEIDKVRLTVEQGGDYADRLAELSVVSSAASTAVEIGPPDSFIDNAILATDVNQARKFDIDGDGDDDFAIQLFRTEGITVPAADPTAASTPVTFDIGVRVYDALSEGSTLQSDPVGLTFTSGQGERRTHPLAVMYSQITQGDRSGSLCQYWKLTSTAGSAPAEMSCN